MNNSLYEQYGKVYTDGLESSSADAMLDSLFESGEALKDYSSNCCLPFVTFRTDPPNLKMGATGNLIRG